MSILSDKEAIIKLEESPLTKFQKKLKHDRDTSPKDPKDYNAFLGALAENPDDTKTI